MMSCKRDATLFGYFGLCATDMCSVLAYKHCIIMFKVDRFSFRFTLAVAATAVVVVVVAVAADVIDFFFEKKKQ